MQVNGYGVLHSHMHVPQVFGAFVDILWHLFCWIYIFFRSFRLSVASWRFMTDNIRFLRLNKTLGWQFFVNKWDCLVTSDICKNVGSKAKIFENITTTLIGFLYLKHSKYQLHVNRFKLSMAITFLISHSGIVWLLNSRLFRFWN